MPVEVRATIKQLHRKRDATTLPLPILVIWQSFACYIIWYVDIHKGEGSYFVQVLVCLLVDFNQLLIQISQWKYCLPKTAICLHRVRVTMMQTGLVITWSNITRHCINKCGEKKKKTCWTPACFEFRPVIFRSTLILLQRDYTIQRDVGCHVREKMYHTDLYGYHGSVWLNHTPPKLTYRSLFFCTDLTGCKC